MKKLLLLAFLSSSTFASNCQLQLLPNGVWFNACPAGTLAEAVDVRTNFNTPFTTVWVRCVRPVLVCTAKKTR